MSEDINYDPVVMGILYQLKETTGKPVTDAQLTYISTLLREYLSEQYVKWFSPDVNVIDTLRKHVEKFNQADVVQPVSSGHYVGNDGKKYIVADTYVAEVTDFSRSPVTKVVSPGLVTPTGVTSTTGLSPAMAALMRKHQGKATIPRVTVPKAAVPGELPSPSISTTTTPVSVPTPVPATTFNPSGLSPAMAALMRKHKVKLPVTQPSVKTDVPTFVPQTIPVQPREAPAVLPRPSSTTGLSPAMAALLKKHSQTSKVTPTPVVQQPKVPAPKPRVPVMDDDLSDIAISPLETGETSVTNPTPVPSITRVDPTPVLIPTTRVTTPPVLPADDVLSSVSQEPLALQPGPALDRQVVTENSSKEIYGLGETEYKGRDSQAGSLPIRMTFSEYDSTHKCFRYTFLKAENDGQPVDIRNLTISGEEQPITVDRPATVTGDGVTLFVNPVSDIRLKKGQYKISTSSVPSKAFTLPELSVDEWMSIPDREKAYENASTKLGDVYDAYYKPQLLPVITLNNVQFRLLPNIPRFVLATLGKQTVYKVFIPDRRSKFKIQLDAQLVLVTSNNGFRLDVGTHRISSIKNGDVIAFTTEKKNDTARTKYIQVNGDDIKYMYLKNGSSLQYTRASKRGNKYDSYLDYQQFVDQPVLSEDIQNFINQSKDTTHYIRSGISETTPASAMPYEESDVVLPLKDLSSTIQILGISDDDENVVEV